ncbi:hypothetical protein [Conexibacter sp. SYSU D00693]|uniref:hypothetical protein n=1 Tax=Conexibacter sp. SYSU D00693 TaxID=2812560 RepID=UPI00196A34F4|nr:hypothetical protein [Conexibacter sp. SYSU D00693]
MAPLAVTFTKPVEGRFYRSTIRRADGCLVAFDGGGWNTVGGPARELPHDLAHFVVEDGLGLTSGVWGVLAAGGLFGHAQVVEGRQAPHAATRGKAIADAAADEVMHAELLVRATADLALAGAHEDRGALRAALRETWWEGHDADAVARTCVALRDASGAWAALERGASLELLWTLGPAATPAPRRRGRRAARGRP